MQPNQPEALQRKIGVRKLAINGVNLTIGAGIFALPAAVAGYVGPAAVLAYAICGLLLGLVLLCFVEVGSRFTTTGGIYAYVEMAFGSYAGFLTNMLFVAFALSADAAVANVLVENLAVLSPIFKSAFVQHGVLIFIFGSIAAVNVLGLKHGLFLIDLITLAKVIPLLLLVLVGSFFISPANLQWNEPLTTESFGQAGIVLFFAFGGGIEATLNTTGEIKNPARTIPRGILMALAMVLAIYVLIQVVAQGVLGDELKIQKEAPLAAVAYSIAGSAGTLLMVIGAVISCFGLISGDILASSRLPYAAARDGLLPRFLAKVHPRYATPYWAVIVHSGLGLLLTFTGGFRQLAILSSSAILLVYVGVILATIKLRKQRTKDSFTLPGGLTVHLLALAATGWFLSYLTQSEIMATAIFIAICSGFYFINARRNRSKG